MFQYIDRFTFCRTGNNTNIKNWIAIQSPNIFTNSNLGKINTIFFSISNYEENSNNDQQFKYVFSRGSHWSLLIINKFHGKLYHFDSTY